MSFAEGLTKAKWIILRIPSLPHNGHCRSRVSISAGLSFRQFNVLILYGLMSCPVANMRRRELVRYPVHFTRGSQ